MKKPDWTNVELVPGVLREPAPDASQLILWLPGDVADGYQHWQRIANVPGAEITHEDGLCRTSATMIRARQKLRGLLGRVLSLFHRSIDEKNWLLPTGDVVEQIGERVNDRMLVWFEPEKGSLEERGIQDRFGHAGEVRRIGKTLFVAVRAQPEAAAVQTDAVPAEITLVEQASKLLDAGRAAQDWHKQASALVDLGVVLLSEGKVPKATEYLQRALEIAQGLKDRPLQSDAQTNLAAALAAVGKMNEAKAILDAELAYALEIGDRFHEKSVLGHLGSVYARVRDHRQAIVVYEKALALARELGDRRHQSELLWSLAIENAELGNRDQALAVAQACVELMRAIGNPKIQAYQQVLDRYRSEDSHNLKWDSKSAISATSTNTVPAIAEGDPSKSRGPGVLRMALSLATSMAKFAGSGLKTVSKKTYQNRLDTCGACPHHTGVRCKLCGCFTKVKAWLPHETCPLAKWPS